MLTAFIQNIKRADTPFYAKLKGIAKAILGFNIPSVKWIHKPLYALHVLVSRMIPFIYIKLWVTPLFKSVCESCGTNLTIYNGMPYLQGNPKIVIGNDVTIACCTIATGHAYDTPTLIIGNNSTIGYGNTISFADKITIGNNVKLAENVFLADNNGHPMHPDARLHDLPIPKSEISPITIGDNVWIGRNCVILKGVKIGENSIIAANTIVTKSVPPNTIIKPGREEAIRNYPKLIAK